MLKLKLHVGKAGWANLDIAYGTASHRIEAFSYTSDSLGDFLRAALMLATGQPWAEVSLDGEPMEWRVLIGPYFGPAEKRWHGSKLRVLTFEDYYARQPEREGSLEFEVECPVEAFPVAVEAMATEILEGLGAADYERRWNMPFPTLALETLRFALSGKALPDSAATGG